MIEDIDYKYVYPAKDGESVHIKLLTGPFEDTVFSYGKVRFEEKDDQRSEEHTSELQSH